MIQTPILSFLRCVDDKLVDWTGFSSRADDKLVFELAPVDSNPGINEKLTNRILTGSPKPW